VVFTLINIHNLGYVHEILRHDRSVALLMLLNSKGRMGRKYASQLLGIGEGAVRDTACKLAKVGRELGINVIDISKGGMCITEEGRNLLKRLLESCNARDYAFIDDAANTLGCGTRCVALVYNGEIKNVVKLRDEIVRNGACGALITRYNGVFDLPLADMQLEDVDFKLASKLKEVLSVVNGDHVIISCGDGYYYAIKALNALGCVKSQVKFRERCKH